MDQIKVRILENAIMIIDEIDGNEYDWLLDHTDARPNQTQHFIAQLVIGLKEMESADVSGD